MNLDLIMWLFVVLCSPIIILVILSALHLEKKIASVIGVMLAVWLALTAATSVPRIGPLPGALFSILLPLVLFSLFLTRSVSARVILAGASVVALVSLHSTRLIGGAFILLHEEGRLANPFAIVAGTGDLVAASLAIPAAIVAWRARDGWEEWVLAWNVIGFLDFVSAIFLGATSQTTFPLRLFFEAPGTALLGELPWRFIPNYFVPLFLMIHIALFVRLVPSVIEKRVLRPVERAEPKGSPS